MSIYEFPLNSIIPSKPVITNSNSGEGGRTAGRGRVTEVLSRLVQTAAVKCRPGTAVGCMHDVMTVREKQKVRQVVFHSATVLRYCERASATITSYRLS